MPIQKAAKKALRQSKKNYTRNSATKKKVKEIIKKIRALIQGKKTDEAKKALPGLYKLLDKAVKTKYYKKNTISRLKSRLTKAANKK